MEWIRDCIIVVNLFCVRSDISKIALDSVVSLMTLQMARCLIGSIILAPLTYSLGEPIFLDRSKVSTLLFTHKQNGQKIIFKFNQELSYIVI